METKTETPIPPMPSGEETLLTKYRESHGKAAKKTKEMKKEEMKEYYKKYNEAHKEKIKEYSARYRQKVKKLMKDEKSFLHKKIDELKAEELKTCLVGIVEQHPAFLFNFLQTMGPPTEIMLTEKAPDFEAEKFCMNGF
jgi:predicted choloylglycine hydrolase